MISKNNIVFIVLLLVTNVDIIAMPLPDKELNVEEYLLGLSAEEIDMEECNLDNFTLENDLKKEKARGQELVQQLNEVQQEAIKQAIQFEQQLSKEKLNTVEKNTQLERTKKEFETAQKNKLELAQQLQNLQGQLKTEQESVKLLADEKQVAISKVTNLDAQLKELQGKLGTEQESVKLLADEKQVAISKVTNLGAQLKELQGKLETSQNKELELTQQLTKEREAIDEKTTQLERTRKYLKIAQRNELELEQQLNNAKLDTAQKTAQSEQTIKDIQGKFEIAQKNELELEQQLNNAKLDTAQKTAQSEQTIKDIQGKFEIAQKNELELEQQLNNAKLDTAQKTAQSEQTIKDIQGKLKIAQNNELALEQQLNNAKLDTAQKTAQSEQTIKDIQGKFEIAQKNELELAQQLSDAKLNTAQKTAQSEQTIKDIQEKLEKEQQSKQELVQQMSDEKLDTAQKTAQPKQQLKNKQESEKEQEESKQALVQQTSDENRQQLNKIAQLKQQLKDKQESEKEQEESKQALVQQMSDEKQREEQELEKLVEVSIPRAVEEISTVVGIAPLMPKIISANSNMFFTRMPIIFKTIGAGDEEESLVSNISKGVWVKGLYSMSKQDMFQNIIGYKSNSKGIVIGFDVETEKAVGDLFGIAYSHICSNFKFQNQNNKILLSGHIISIYGQKNLGNSLSLQGVFSTTRNYVTNKSIRSMDDITYNVSGKYQNNSYHFDTRLNYNIGFSQGFTLIPGIGIRYEQYQDSAYTETNIETYNLSLKAKSQNFWVGSIGSKLLLPALPTTQNVTITPILHGIIEKYLNNKSQKIDSKILINNIIFEQQTILPKQSAISYNIGTSLLLARRNTEILMEYNCHLSKGYRSHQGSIRLKIMF